MALIRFSLELTRNLKAIILFGALTWIGTGCGSVGPPIPPEDIGIEKKLKQERERAKAQSQEPQLVPLEEGEVHLPPLRPIGTR